MSGTAPASLYGADASPEERRRLLTDGRLPVAVHGLGKVRLPLAAVFAEVTWIVTRFDVDREVVKRIGRGDCPVENEPGLPAAVSSAVDSGALCATADQQAAAATAKLHVVIVPTVIDDDG